MTTYVVGRKVEKFLIIGLCCGWRQSGSFVFWDTVNNY